MTAMIQQTEEWKEMRRNKIGASDAPPIMEVSPWKTPYQLWLEKMQIVKDQKANESMQRGNALEGPARELFCEMTGIKMKPAVLISLEHNWMMASLDGIDEKGKQIVEIKCANKTDHQCAESGKIPEKYVPQLQHQLAVCELEMAYYFSFNGEKGVIVEVYRDDSYIKSMIEKELIFWECMQNFCPPEMSKKDYKQNEDPLFEITALEILSLKDKIKELEKKEEILQNILISKYKNENVKGNGFRILNSIRKGSIQYERIPELKGIDLEKYRKQASTTWRITRE